MSEHYILNGREPVACDLMTWARWIEDHRAEKRVALDEFDGVKVSTVFLGLDHNWGAGPPMLFETMVFGGPLDDEMYRYSTYDQAEAGHAMMVARARAALQSTGDT